MKKTYILLMLCCALMACKKNTIDFSYSPQEPRAGQTVTFSNLCSTGEEWEWTFGDGATSTIKTPTHTYKQPGSYTVMLKVDKKKSWTVSKQITVTDTVPTFVASDTVFYIFKDYTFTAQLYNPYNYDVSLEWAVPDTTVAQLKGNSVVCCFTEPNKEATVGLRLVLNKDTMWIEKHYYIRDREAGSILLRTKESDWRQRIFEDRAEQPKSIAHNELLDDEQDTAQIYNGRDFRLSILADYIPNIKGFKIANRKIYYRANGLWVAHIDGSDPVQIDSDPCSAMTLDTQNNRIYWATAEGVWYMPFVGSDNNKFVTVPTQLNNMDEVTKLAVDYEYK